VDRIRIEINPREFGHSAAYDALADDLHAQGWTMVIIEPSEDLPEPGLDYVPHEFYSVAVYLSQHVADGVLAALVASLIDRLRRTREGWSRLTRQAVIYGPSGEVLRVVELDEEEAPPH
jgi:hypothetical protein